MQDRKLLKYVCYYMRVEIIICINTYDAFFSDRCVVSTIYVWTFNPYKGTMWFCDDDPEDDIRK